MASSSSHDASSSERKDYDVFLSFRGEDTGGRGDGHGYFAGYLKEALKKEKIITFFADESLESGQEISREIHKAIENSKIAVVILSRNFPGSRWCLDELVKILECEKNKRLYVIPIFYHIKPDAVRTLDGHLKQAFEYSESKAVRDGTPEKVEKWREALKEVGNMSGKVWTEREEEKLIQDTVRRISDKLSKTVWSIPSHIVGIDECVRIVEGKLEIGSMGTGIIVGIWGMAGIGKTTLAQVIYEKIRKDFDESSFLADVSKSIERDGGEDLQKEFSKTLGLHIGVFANCNRSKEIRERLKSLNVLVVVVNVDKQEQVTRILKNVKGTESKSRIIVTTTDKHVLKRIGVENIYEVGELDDGKALTVFQNYARRAPEMGEKEYESLCGEVVRYCCGIPLALEVLGSFLDTRSTEEWRSTLHKLKKIPNKKILDRLEISYKGLDEQQQRVFLCVSCIFEGENEERVIFLLDCLGLFPKTNLQVLKERCLVKNLHGRVDMHDILRKMGRHIVQQKSANERWVLLFSATDIENFLKRNSGADAEIMVIKLKREDRCMQQFHLNVLKNFRQLKLLTIIGGEDNFSGKVEHLSDNLRYLRWDACPLQSLPSDFRGPHLRGLALPSSSIQYLRSGGESFAKLEVIQVCECKALTEIPDISNLPDLRTLDLQGCVQLVAVRLSNTRHERLEHINLKGCMKLIHLPERILFPSLRSFTLSGCSKLERLPEIMGRMDQLRELHIDGTAIMELPRSIKFLPRLQTLKANNCRNLSSLPDIKDKLNGLRFVDLLDCPNLKEEEVRSRLVDVEHVRFGENREDPQSQDEIKDGSLVIQADKGVGCCSIM